MNSMKQNISQIGQLNKVNQSNQKWAQSNINNKQQEISQIKNENEKRILIEPKMTKLTSIPNCQSDQQRKDLIFSNSRSSFKTTEEYQSRQSQANSAEDHIQDQEETKGTLPHNLYTKRNSLVLEKENLTSQKYIQDEEGSWKEKYLELQKINQENSRQQFIQERKIQDLQIQLQNERNKTKFLEKNQEIALSLKKELDEEKIKCKQIEDKLQQAQQQIQSQKANNQKQQQVGSSLTNTQQAQYNYVSFRKKSLEGSCKINIESRNRQSLSKLETRKEDDENKARVLQMNQLQNVSQQNKNLLLKVSEQQKQIQYLLDQQYCKEQSLEMLSQENNILGNQLREYTQILGKLGYFQVQKQMPNLVSMNQINQNNQDQNQNKFIQIRNFSGIPTQKNENFESISDQSFTNKASSYINFTEDNIKPTYKNKNEVQQMQQLKENHKQNQKRNTENKNLEQMHFQELKKQLDYPYQNEIQFIQDNGENTYRLSKLCTC
ncbi:hypothetical protein ABPG72_011045 [Tetrahymena utriculariae]